MTLGLGEFYSLSCALAWAVAVVLFKKSGESLPPLALNLFKNVLGLVLMALTVLALDGLALPELPAGAWLLVLLSGLLGIALGDTLYLQALNAIGASRMGVAQTLYSPFVIVLSLIFLGERLVTWQWLGAALVLAGVVLVSVTRGTAASASGRARAANGRGGGTGTAHRAALGRGFLLAALSVLAMAAGVVMAKPLLERYDFLWVVMLRIAAGTAGVLLFVAAQRRLRAVWDSFRAVRHWPQVIAGSIMGTYISMLLWLAGYKYTSASVAAVLNEMAAVFIIALAAMFLHERLTPRQLTGSAVALAGVLLVVWP